MTVACQVLTVDNLGCSECVKLTVDKMETVACQVLTVDNLGCSECVKLPVDG